MTNTLTGVLITFVGDSGNLDQQPLWISPANIVKTGGLATADVVVRTVTDGATGEVQVNETTKGDQVLPDVAMDAQGNFIVTWTSYGQDGDNAIQSNVYAKRFTSTSSVWSSASIDPGVANTPPTTDAVPQINTIDNPNSHIVEPGTGYDGIVQVHINDDGEEGTGTGELLAGGNDTTGYWVLTAAHVVFSETRMVPLLADAANEFVDVQIFTPDFPDGVMVRATQVIVNPGYIDTQHFLLGNDLALIHLDAVDRFGVAVPAAVKTQGFQIYTKSDEVGQVFEQIGFGRFGSGGAGSYGKDDQKRRAWNIFDATGAATGYVDTQLVFDFDDGTAAHDAMGVMYGIHNVDTTLVNSKQEGMTAQGDSGGPALIDGKIAAICSGGGGSLADINTQTDSSFGEIGWETRISSFAPWINSITNVLGTTLIPGTEFLVNKNDPVTPQFDVNDTIAYLVLDNQTGNQSHSSVAMDLNGDFVVTWTSYGHDRIGNGYGAGDTGQNGIFARRYNANGSIGQRRVPGESDRLRETSKTRRSRWTPPAISPSPGKAIKTATSTSTPAAMLAPVSSSISKMPFPTPPHSSICCGPGRTRSTPLTPWPSTGCW